MKSGRILVVTNTTLPTMSGAPVMMQVIRRIGCDHVKN
jgi:hypothetical protein